MDKKLIELAELIKKSKYVVIFTGAGMDTESNIPDFRGNNGLWNNIDPRTIASADSVDKDYSFFHKFYKARIKMLDNCKPHKGHYILADWEERGIIKSLATQNISGFHTIAGNKNVSELHGNIRTFKCNNCNKLAHTIEFLEKRNCKNCGHERLRPNLTLFGESLPEGDWNRALGEIEKSDLLIVIGTSLEVAPVNQLPDIARGKTVYINNENKQRIHKFDFVLKAKAGELLEELATYV